MQGLRGPGRGVVGGDGSEVGHRRAPSQAHPIDHGNGSRLVVGYCGPIESCLSPLEIATSIPTGSVKDPDPLPEVAGCLHPLQALEDAVRPALLRPPCVLSFSGGRDSSAVLAVATRLARQEGHPLPVPVTMRFRDAEDTNESEWQEMVIEHLQLRDWEKLDFSDELDSLGPISTAVLRRHGLLWPPNAYAHVVIIGKAAGGSVVTGLDGDSVFGSWRYSLLSQLRRAQMRPKRAHLRLAVAAGAPGALRRHLVRPAVLSEAAGITWLSSPARRHFIELRVADQASEPASWPRRLAWLTGRRYMRLAVSSLDRLGADADVRMFHPLIATAFLSSLGNWGGGTGPGDRTRAMTQLFGGLLPSAVVARRTKAVFDGAYWRSGTASFVRQWRGAGVDAELVDTEQLQRIWKDGKPTYRTTLLAQQAWLATTRPAGDAGSIGGAGI